MVHSALTTRFAITTDRSSRNGRRPNSIGHHHAASTSLEGTLALFQPGGRQVSPNYCIAGKEIVLVVPEEYRPWTTGSALDDQDAITYEIVNSTGPNAWAFAQETLRSVAKLNADVATRYDIPLRLGQPGFWEHRNIYEWHKRSYPTACAGPSFKMTEILALTRGYMEVSEMTFTLEQLLNAPLIGSAGVDAADKQNIEFDRAVSRTYRRVTQGLAAIGRLSGRVAGIEVKLDTVLRELAKPRPTEIPLETLVTALQVPEVTDAFAEAFARRVSEGPAEELPAP